MDRSHEGSKLARDETTSSPPKIADLQDQLHVYEERENPPPLGPTLNEEEAEKSKLERANFELKMQVFQLEKKLSETCDGVENAERLESTALSTSQHSNLAHDDSRSLAEERHSQLMQQLDDKTRLLEDTARAVQERDYFLEQARGAIEHLQADVSDSQNKYERMHEEKVQSDNQCDGYLRQIQLLEQSKNQLSRELALATKKVKEFEEMKQTYETLSLQNHELRHQLEDAKVAYSTIERRKQKADADFKECVQDRTVAERHVEAQADEIRSLREDNLSLSREIEEFKKQSVEVECLKEQIEERDVVLEQAKNAIETLQSAVRARDQEKAILEELRSQAHNELKDSIEASRQADDRHCRLSTELAAMKEEKKLMQHSIQKLEEERNYLNDNVEKLGRSKADAVSASLSSKADLHRAKEEKIVVNNELKDLQLKYEKLCTQYSDLQTMLAEKEHQLRIVEQDLAGYELQVHQHSSKISLLEGDLMSAKDERSRLTKSYHRGLRKMSHELHSMKKRAEDSDEKLGKATEEANAKDKEITALDRSLRDIKKELEDLRHAKPNEETVLPRHNSTENGGENSLLHLGSRTNSIYYDLDCKHKELESLLVGFKKTVKLSNALVGRFQQIREENHSSKAGTSQSTKLQEAQGLVLLEGYCKQVLERNYRLSVQAHQIGKDLRIVYTRFKALEASLGKRHADNKSIDRRSIDRNI